MTVKNLLDDLHDLQALEPGSLVICNAMGFTFEPSMILKDRMNHTGGNRFYIKPSGLAGGGRYKATVKDDKQKDKKKEGAKLKLGMIAKLQESLNKAKTEMRAEVFDKTSEIIQKTLQSLNALEKVMEADPHKAFRILLGKMKLETIGSSKDSSPLLQLIDANNNKEARLDTLGKRVVDEVYEDLSNVMEEVSGVLESASLLFDITMTNAYYNSETLQWNWSSVKGAVEAEIIRRADALEDVDALTRAMGDMRMAD